MLTNDHPLIRRIRADLADSYDEDSLAPRQAQRTPAIFASLKNTSVLSISPVKVAAPPPKALRERTKVWPMREFATLPRT